MRKWFKPKLLVMFLPALAALIVLPFWTSSTAYANTDSIASGTLPWNNANGNGVSTPFQMAAISSFLSGTLACPNMLQSVPNHGTPTLQIWLIEDSHGGRLDASGETHCTQTQTPWSLAAGQNPAGHYHLWVNCHWGGCGHDVKVSYSVDTKIAAPANNALTADQLLNQTLKTQTPKPAQANAVHAGWATSASPGTGLFPSSSIQSKIAADAVVACNNPAGTLRMSIKISPNSALNPNKVLNSTNLSCQSGSGHTDDLSVSTDMGFIVTFDNATNTGNWAVKYVASADKPLPTPPSNPLPAPPSGGDTPPSQQMPLPAPPSGGDTPPSQQTPYDYCALGYNGSGAADVTTVCAQGSTSGFDYCVTGYNHANPHAHAGEAKSVCSWYSQSQPTSLISPATALYCKDGINSGGQGIIQSAGIPINAHTDCSDASSAGSLNDCIAGYVLDDWQKDDLNETFTDQVNRLKQEATTIGPCGSYHG